MVESIGKKRKYERERRRKDREEETFLSSLGQE